MKRIKEMLNKINFSDFRGYLFFSLLLIVTLISLGSFRFTQARYESETSVSASPTLAFFIVDVTTASGQIKLDSMIPSTTPYTYTFQVSNFKNNRRANVDLTYSIELITTTNVELEFKIFKGNNMELNEIDSDIITTDDNGVYYRHLIINDVSVMSHSSNCTDTYTLWVSFPVNKKNNPEAYAGIIDLVDIKISAEQVV